MLDIGGVDRIVTLKNVLYQGLGSLHGVCRFGRHNSFVRASETLVGWGVNWEERFGKQWCNRLKQTKLYNLEFRSSTRIMPIWSVLRSVMSFDALE